MQLLRSLLKQISYESVRGADDRTITDICCHSEKVKEGSLFVCINGYRNNGHEYVPQAVEHGAAVLVVDDRYVIGSRSGPVILTEHMKVDVHELILHADENLISQVVINLLKNAIQAIGDQPDGQIDIQVYCNETEEVLIEIKNNGPVIPPEIVEHIFIPFFTTKEGGSGIGLSISRQIMRLSGGSLTLLPDNKETKFILKFK